MSKKKTNSKLKYFGIGALIIAVSFVAYRLFSGNKKTNSTNSNVNSNGNSNNKETYANGESYAEYQSNKNKNFATLTENECAFPNYQAEKIDNLELKKLFDNIIIPFDDGENYDEKTKKYKKFGYRTKNYTPTISKVNPVTGVYSIIYVPTGELIETIDSDFYTKLLNRATKISPGGSISESEAIVKALGHKENYISRVEV